MAKRPTVQPAKSIAPVSLKAFTGYRGRTADSPMSKMMDRHLKKIVNKGC